MKFIYHSALQKDMDLPELSLYESKGSIVFQHDLTQGIPEIFKSVDAIYSEPSWQAGYEIFQDRARAGNSTFKEYLLAIGGLIRTLNKPTFIVLGKHMLKGEGSLRPDFVTRIKLHGYSSFLGVWNGKSLDVKTNEEALEHVVGMYGNILDFSCGYGNLAKSAIGHGKRFICSDLNARCVYYIAKTYMGYNG